MFTGIIEKVGKLKYKKTKAGMHELGFSVESLWPDITVGESIAINGVCLTITKKTYDTFFTDVSGPTLKSTNLGKLTIGSSVNLERALKVGDRLGGHFVQGHVDGVGSIRDMSKKNDNIFLYISARKDIMNHLIDKGSIAVNGVSLTIQELYDDSFSVVIIPYTWKYTTFANVRVHDTMNIEVDLIGKYVQKHTAMKRQPLTMEYLKEQGF